MSILTSLHNIDRLPTLPEVLLEVLKMINSEKTDASELSKVIEEDPALCARILHIANSSFYRIATGRRLSSVQLAIARLGMDEVRNIAVAISIVKHFADHRGALDHKQFWRHCLTGAFLCRAIGEKTNPAQDDLTAQQFFLAGLLHDIGILLLDQFFPEMFQKVSEYASAHEMSFRAAEAVIMEKETHPVIGGALLEIWYMAPPVIDAVRFHHAPGKSPQKHATICAATGLAEYVLCNCAIGSQEGGYDGDDMTIWQRTGISQDQVHELSRLAEIEVCKSDLILMLGGGETKKLKSV